MLTFASRYARNTYSQNGEDGIIAECLKRIKPGLTVSVEFGAPDRFFCSNTAALPDDWAKHYYSIDASDGVEAKTVTPDNVNELPVCSVLSIDIDGNDYNVWEAYSGKPDIVIIEVNSSFAPYVYHWSLDRGSSYSTMNKLAEGKGYFLLCHTGNCIFIRNDHRGLFPEITLDPMINHSAYFNSSWL